MFRTVEKPATTNEIPRYDSETVREVLARASEIEAQTETELLTATQVEALGSELGLSPEAVRRALGEKSGVASEVAKTSTITRDKALEPLTQERIKAAYLPNLWYGLVCFPIIFALYRLMHGGTTPSEIGVPMAIAVAFVVPVYLAFRSGFLTKEARVGAVGGLLTVLLVSSIALIAGGMAMPGSSMQRVDRIVLLVLIIGAAFGALGSGVRHWWDRLPRNSDR
jgi:hypothetical protein